MGNVQRSLIALSRLSSKYRLRLGDENPFFGFNIAKRTGCLTSLFSTNFSCESTYLQNPNQCRNYRDRYSAWLRRGVARDLDVVPSLSRREILRSYRVAAGHDSASSRAAGAIDWQRRRQRIGFAGDRLSRPV